MAAAGLPLRCCICPKQPKFSDVSHLLTHVGSKGHLSHHYRVKVRSGHETGSRGLLRDYDDWYTTWNVEQLMSQRMDMKDKKRPRVRAQQYHAWEQVKLETNALDPFLAPDLDASNNHLPTTNPFDELDVFGPIHFHRPRLFLWPTFRPAAFDVTPLEPLSPLHACMIPSVEFPRLPSANPFVLNDSEEELDAGVTEAARLKGVFWPGMDIFDAAPPDTRRMRNQKKDISVLKHLEQSSLRVLPHEVVYTPHGAHSKHRTITGRVDFDSSPSRLMDPTPSPQIITKKKIRKCVAKPPKARAPKAGKPRGRPRKTKLDEHLHSLVNSATPSRRRKAPLGPSLGIENHINHAANNLKLNYMDSEARPHIKEACQPAHSCHSSPNTFDDNDMFPEAYRLHQALSNMAAAGLLNYPGRSATNLDNLFHCH